jgi:hypothetical protein
VLLSSTSAALASSYSFVNPVIAPGPLVLDNERICAPVRSHLAYHQRFETALVTDVSLLRNPVNLDELNALIGEPHTPYR